MIDASGVIQTMCPQGTRVSIVIRPDVADYSPDIAWTIQPEDRIDLDLEPGACDPGTVGPPREGERTLAIGRYDVAAVTELLSDVIPSPPVPDEETQFRPACVASFEVTVTTTRVHIDAEFGATNTELCAITAETE